MKIRAVGAELFHADRQTWQNWYSFFAILWTCLKLAKDHTMPSHWSYCTQQFFVQRPQNPCHLLGRHKRN